MSEVQQEKDYFWFYVGGLVVAMIVVVLMVKGTEHGKYEAAKQAIAEDAAYKGRVTVNN